MLVKKIVRKVVRKARNIWAWSLGNFASCDICGDSWHWKEPYTINLDDANGIFSYCTECARTATVEQKKAALCNLLNRLRAWQA